MSYATGSSPTSSRPTSAAPQGARRERASPRASEPSGMVFSSLVHHRRLRPFLRIDGAPMSEPPSPTVGANATAVVVGADEQFDVVVDVDRWCRLAAAALTTEGASGELTLTFVDRDEIAALNVEHLGQE